jgi:hypothetical protein
MIEIILSEHQFARLKAAVPMGSVEHAALEAGAYFAGSELVPEPIAVTLTCSLELAQQLLAIARMACPDVATGGSRCDRPTAALGRRGLRPAVRTMGQEGHDRGRWAD